MNFQPPDGDVKDPHGCNACAHPACGRFEGPQGIECRAMADNACARKYPAKMWARSDEVKAPDMTRSPALIVDETERLAGLLASRFHGSKLTRGTYRESTNPKAQKCWKVACEIQELLTQTDPENAVAELGA